MGRFVVLLMIAMTLGGCSTYAIDRYAISADSVIVLRSYKDQKINVGEFTSTIPGLNHIDCRAVGPVKTPDGEPFSDFIRDALIDELQIAEAYSVDAPVILTGNVDHIDFSSAEGFWDIQLTVKSSNGQELSISENYKYTTSWYGETACNQTAQAMMPAIQNLIQSLVTNPKFPDLIM